MSTARASWPHSRSRLLGNGLGGHATTQTCLLQFSGRYTHHGFVQARPIQVIFGHSGQGAKRWSLAGLCFYLGRFLLVQWLFRRFVFCGGCSAASAPIDGGVQCIKQLNRRSAWLVPIAHFTKHAVHFPGGSHDGIHHFRIQQQGLGAKFVKQVFCFVAQLDHMGGFEKTRAALDGVKATKHGGQQFRVFRALLQFHQFAVHVFQQIPCFSQEVLQQFNVAECAHVLSLSTA